MLIFMVSMVLLYFIGVLVSYMVLRKKRERDLAAGAAREWRIEPEDSAEYWLDICGDPRRYGRDGLRA